MNSASPEPETALPVEPEGAVLALFGDRSDIARRFCGHLATTAVTRGLIGPREVPRLWERHVLNCAAVAERIPENASVVDVGSGAGLPGIALATARADITVLLVEPLQRRVTWLEEVVADLGLANTAVRRARAEDLQGAVAADVVTARAVAGLTVLAGLCLPLVRPGGRFVAVKGRSADEELAAAAGDLGRMGAAHWEVLRCGLGVMAEPTTVVEVTMGRGTKTAARGPKGRAGRKAGGRRR